MKEEKLTYEQAVKRLEEIVSCVEQGEVGIDSLTDMLKEAKLLIAYCKDKLYTTEEEIKKIMDEEEKK